MKKETKNPEVIKTVQVRQWPKVVLGVLVLLVAVSAWVYGSYFKPLTEMFLSLEKTFQARSAEVEYEFKDSNFGVVAKMSNRIAEGEISSMVVSGDGFKAEGRVGKTDLFVQANIDDVSGLTDSLRSIDPSLIKKQSYADLLRMITGQTWMHWNLTDKWWGQEDVKVEWAKMSKKEEIKAWWNILKVVKVNKYEKGVEINGQKYDRIILGFRKGGLLALIENLKKQDVDIKLSQINAMKKVIESSNDWDKDLVEYLIDKEGRLAVLDLKMPKIEKEVLNDSVKEGVEDNPGLAGIWGGLGEGLTRGLNQNKESGELIGLGKITVGEYDLPTDVTMPTSKIEWEVWSKRALEDYRPLIMQFMGAMMQQ